MESDNEKVSTKERLLVAAEKLFAEKGFQEVSLRDITKEANANVASVNYYFSSKDVLADEVITRHISPVNDARLEALETLKKKYGDAAFPLREILQAFMKPMVEQMHSSGLRSDLFGKVMGRCMADRGKKMPVQVEPQMKAVLGAFISELIKALPNLDAETVLWRLHFSFGVVAHTLLFSDRIADFTEMPLEGMGMDASLERVVDYCCGGLLAEVSAEQQGGEQ